MSMESVCVCVCFDSWRMLLLYECAKHSGVGMFQPCQPNSDTTKLKHRVYIYTCMPLRIASE